MRYQGVIVCRPPEALSYDPQQATPASLTRAQQLELTRAQTEALLRNLPGKPILTEHGGEPVGTVTAAFFNEEGDACVRFDLADSPAAAGTHRLVEAGYLRGLSLSHHHGTDQPVEVSLCFQGARPGTGLAGSASAASKPTPAAPPAQQTRWTVRASSLTPLVMATTAAAPAAPAAAPKAAGPPPPSAAAPTAPPAEAAPKRRATEGPEGTPAPVDADAVARLLRKVAEGQMLTQEEQVELIQAIAQERGAARAAQDRLKELQSKPTFDPHHFMQVLAPFIQTYCGAESLPPAEAQRLATQMSQGQGFPPEAQALLVKASTLATEERQRAHLNPRVAQALSQLEHLRQTGQPPSGAYGWSLAPPPPAQQPALFAQPALVQASVHPQTLAPPQAAPQVNPFAALDQLAVGLPKDEVTVDRSAYARAEQIRDDGAPRYNPLSFLPQPR